MSNLDPDPDGLRRPAWHGWAAVAAAFVGMLTVAALVVTATEAVRQPDGATGPPGSSSSAATADTTVPAGFPLAAGWPHASRVDDRGPRLRGPAADLERAGVDLTACGRPHPLPATTEPLRATWSDVVDERRRLLAPFADAAAAAAWVDDLAAAYDDCPVEEPDADLAGLQREVLVTELGSQSFAVIGRPTYDGSPGVQLRVVHVVRLGRAVLIDFVANEDGGGADQDADETQQVAEMAAESAQVLASMCIFAEPSC